MYRCKAVILAFVLLAAGFVLPVQAHTRPPFTMPARFRGVMPCADCPGIRVTIELEADGSYKLEREYLERPSGAGSSEIGTWDYDEFKSLLTLRPAGKNALPEFFAVNLNPTLQMLDAEAKPLPPGLNSTLENVSMTFSDEPRHHQSLRLDSVRWQLAVLSGKTVTPPSQALRPTLIFSAAAKRVTGSGGCNQISGSYKVAGDKLHFGPIVSTLMACAHGMDTEAAFLGALANVNSYQIVGNSLSLYDKSNRLVAVLRAEK